jgi:hypothetical protein
MVHFHAFHTVQIKPKEPSVSKDLMFYCIPQQAYMRTENCTNLRKRPAGKAPAGAQPMLRACEKCTMYPLVDKEKVPTVSLVDYLGGSKPRIANLQAAANKKIMQAASVAK